MKKLALLVIVLSLAIMSAASAGIILSEDWETGTDGWTQYGSAEPHPALATDQVAGGSYSMRTANNSTTNYTNGLDYVLAAPTATSWTLTYDFFDTGATRDYIQIDSYSGGAIGSGSLQQLMCFGAYNNPGGATYNYRVAVGAASWQASTVTKVNNVWHSVKVQQTDNGNGTATVDFYCDNVLANTVNTTAVFGVTALRLGSGLTNGGAGMYFDNIVLSTPDVPEPGSLLAMGTGLIGLLGLIRRKRA